MRAIPENIGVIHFVGIGGIGMSGIAEILHNMGYKVQGSDLNESGNVARLREKGIRIETGHRAENIMAQGKPPAVVVVSSAVKPDNPEVVAAREVKTPVIRRAEMLAELMRLKHSISVGGTHGKTTTTSLIGAVLEGGGLDPTVINGGIVNAYGTNVRMGEGVWMVVEADESDGTFVKLPSTVAIVTNIDPEHMDHYSSFDDLKNAFRQFVLNIPFYGFGVLCLDHPEVQAMIPRIGDRRIITYGFNPQAHVRAENVVGIPGGNRFDVALSAQQFGQDRVIRGISLPMLGLHNVQNALAAVATGVALGVPDEQLRNSLGAFTGVKRRFTRTGESNGVTVIDDYGHHPVEIAAVLKAARAELNTRGKGRIVAIVQPHRYTRLSRLFEEFCTCFNDADTVIVADVYAAGEEPIAGASRQALADGLKSRGHRDVRSLESPDDLPAMVAGVARSGDFAICLGAGNITQWAYKLPQQLDEIFASPAGKQSKGNA